MTSISMTEIKLLDEGTGESITLALGRGFGITLRYEPQDHPEGYEICLRLDRELALQVCTSMHDLLHQPKAIEHDEFVNTRSAPV
jgi:hypothetical protein